MTSSSSSNKLATMLKPSPDDPKYITKNIAIDIVFYLIGSLLGYIITELAKVYGNSHDIRWLFIQLLLNSLVLSIIKKILGSAPTFFTLGFFGIQVITIRDKIALK